MLRVHSAGNAYIFLRPWSPNVDGITEGTVFQWWIMFLGWRTKISWIAQGGKSSVDSLRWKCVREGVDLLGRENKSRGFGCNVAAPWSEKRMDSLKREERWSEVRTWCWIEALFDHNWGEGNYNMDMLFDIGTRIVVEYRGLKCLSVSNSTFLESITSYWTFQGFMCLWDVLVMGAFMQAIAEMIVSRYFAERVNPVSFLFFFLNSLKRVFELRTSFLSLTIWGQIHSMGALGLKHILTMSIINVTHEYVFSFSLT